MCQFSYYKEEEKGEYYPQLYCHLRDGDVNNYCQYRKKCEDKQKYIIIDGLWKECYIMNDFIKNKEIPMGSNRVVSYVEKKGKVRLFVALDNETNIVVNSPNNKPLDYVYLVKDGDNYIAYEEPQKQEKVKTAIVVDEDKPIKKKNGKKRS